MRCGIATYLMSAWGHKARSRPQPAILLTSQLPTSHRIAVTDAECQKATMQRNKTAASVAQFPLRLIGLTGTAQQIRGVANAIKPMPSDTLTYTLKAVESE